MRIELRHTGALFCTLTLSTFIWCEYLIYYFTMTKGAILLAVCSGSHTNRCEWSTFDTDVRLAVKSDYDDPLKVFFIADPHLLGPYRGHWFDKLRREWQMHRAYMTAVSKFNPDVIFFLGDVFDEGHWVSENGFKEYFTRFTSLFPAIGSAKIFAVPGNHDMGFHYALSPDRESRFNAAFRSKSVRLITIKGVHFLLVNSMALEQDGCSLCHNAEVRLRNLAVRFECERDPSSRRSCRNQDTSKASVQEYSAPIILQHFPMYRDSDELCTGPDAAPEQEKLIKFREAWECLSKNSTEFLLESFLPRLVLSGHTHHGCVVTHKMKRIDLSAEEHSVPSFSWRNRNNPSFYMGIFTPKSYKVTKCLLPEETTVIFLYSCFLLITVLMIINLIFVVLSRHFEVFSKKKS